MRRIAAITLLLLALASGAIYWTYVRSRPPTDPDAELAARTPVPNNRGPEVADGLGGDVHPFLKRQAQTEVTATWELPKENDLDPALSAEVRDLYTNVRVADLSKSYSERNFAGLLPPPSVKNAGQLWALDLDKVAVFLKQFHPAVSMRSASVGRRPGPDGAFAMLRGVSSSHVDIVFRVHAEFDLLPKSSALPVIRAWYSPACFLGRLVVNRDAGTVEYFQMGVPTEKKTNVHFTIWTARGSHHHNVDRVDRMELIAGNMQGMDRVLWTEQIELVKAHDKLAKVFYKFKDIEFVPFDKSLAAARAQKKPILAVVLLGALDDQGC